jgi:hypothetical protein
MSLSSYALTTVQAVLNYSGLVTDDTARIESLINAMTDRMERECSRKFKARDFVEWYNVSGNQEEFVLNNYPVIRAPAIAFGGQPCLTVSYSGSAIEAVASVSLDRLTLTTYSTSGVRTQNDYLFTDYASVSTLAAALNLVSGITASVTVNVPSFRICPTSGFNLLFTPALFLCPLYNIYNPATDYNTGIVAYRRGFWAGESPHFARTFPSGHQQILAEYRAGYETIPDDLAMLCNELVMDAYNRSSRDVTVTSETLDQYSYTLADSVKFSDGIRARLSRYMRFSVGGV